MVFRGRPFYLLATVMIELPFVSFNGGQAAFEIQFFKNKPFFPSKKELTVDHYSLPTTTWYSMIVLELEANNSCTIILY